jgi:ribose 5-phosphate isomerase B
MIKLALGSDHAGFGLKEACIDHLVDRSGVEVVDKGVYGTVSSDYPDIAHLVAAGVAEGSFDKAILICGTGIGMSITANRHKAVRAALCHNLYTVKMARMHNDANLLAMGSRVIGEGLALEMVDLFLDTAFEAGRHARRLGLIDESPCL